MWVVSDYSDVVGAGGSGAVVLSDPWPLFSPPTLPPIQAKPFNNADGIPPDPRLTLGRGAWVSKGE